MMLREEISCFATEFSQIGLLFLSSRAICKLSCLDNHPSVFPGGDGWRLYEYITRHFIATVSADCKYLQTTIAFSIGPECFTCIGKTVISAGKGMKE